MFKKQLITNVYVLKQAENVKISHRITTEFKGAEHMFGPKTRSCHDVTYYMEYRTICGRHTHKHTGTHKWIIDKVLVKCMRLSTALLKTDTEHPVMLLKMERKDITQL